MPNNLNQPTNSPALKSLKVKNGKHALKGTVVEALPNTLFKVQLETGQVILTYLSGRMRQNYIRVSTGDSVTIELDSIDNINENTKGRIIFREK